MQHQGESLFARNVEMARRGGSRGGGTDEGRSEGKAAGSVYICHLLLPRPRMPRRNGEGGREARGGGEWG